MHTEHRVSSGAELRALALGEFRRELDQLREAADAPAGDDPEFRERLARLEGQVAEFGAMLARFAARTYIIDVERGPDGLLASMTIRPEES